MVRATLGESEIRRVIGVPGAGDLVVDGIASLEARADRCLYFVNQSLSPAARESLAARHGCIAIAPPGFATAGPLGTCVILEVAQPRTAIARILGFVRDEGRQRPWVETRRIAASAVLSPLAVVEGTVEIGEGVVVEPFCTIGPDVTI